jgi:hypothetical protein
MSPRKYIAPLLPESVGYHVLFTRSTKNEGIMGLSEWFIQKETEIGSMISGIVDLYQTL